MPQQRINAQASTPVLTGQHERMLASAKPREEKLLEGYGGESLGESQRNVKKVFQFPA
jgi:hypothetical protein